MLRLRIITIVLLLQSLIPARDLLGQKSEQARVLIELVNIRETASIQARIVMTATRGTSVTVIERTAGWARVSVGGKTGYVRASLISAPADGEATTSRPAAKEPPATPEPQRVSPPLPRSDAPVLPRRGVPDNEQGRSTRKEGSGRASDARRGEASGAGGESPFEIGRTYAGAVLNFGVFGSTAFGAFVERGVKTINDDGTFTLGIGASVDHYDVVTPIALFGSVHFQQDNDRLDAFVAVSVGYNKVSDKSGEYGYAYGYDFGSGYGTSGLYRSVRGGVRYYLTPRLAMQGTLGYGLGYVGLGMVTRF